MSIRSLQKIQVLNDRFRTGKKTPYDLRLSEGVRNLGSECVRDIMRQVETFDQFTEDVDNRGEHAAGRVRNGDVEIRWYINYLGYGASSYSPDPSDPTVTMRLLAIDIETEYVVYYGK